MSSLQNPKHTGTHLTIRGDSIEGNCVLIGACIPCLYPLVKRVFGASALGGSTPKESHQKQSDQNNNTIITIGSYPKKKRGKGTLGLSQLDTINDESKYIILEERSFHASTTELRAEETAVQNQEQQRAKQQGRATHQPAW